MTTSTGAIPRRGPQTLVVVVGARASSPIGEMLMVDPRDMLAAVLEDHLVAWDDALAAPEVPTRRVSARGTIRAVR
jgi:hypothetical protein